MVAQKKEKLIKFPNKNPWSWLDDAGFHEKQGFTFPQVKANLILYETPGSLDGKVPMVPGLSDMIDLATTKIGTKRFRVPPDAEFDLSEPYRPPPEYNFLHDPHLHDYLNNSLVRKRLTEKGLVTKDGYVKCTIKEFNDYRQWIRKLKLDAIDQDWHLQKANQVKTEKASKNHEATQISKQRQERAKQLYDQKLKKKEQERKKYLKYMEEKELYIEKMKNEMNRMFDQRKMKRNQDREIKLQQYREKEKEGKRIRIRILFDSKESIKKREERINALHQEKLLEKEKRTETVWKRKQSYCLEKMEEEREGREHEVYARRQSISRRESVYQRERRRSDAYMLQHAQENRSNAMRHLEEASEFLSRIEAKKEEEIQKWREKLKCIKEREALLDYYRQNRKYDQKAGMYRRRHSKSRKSAWDVDKVLLNQLMESFTEEERHELEKLQNKEANEDSKEPMTSSYNAIESKVSSHLKTNLIEQKISFVTFGNIQPDDVVDVYHESKRQSIVPNLAGKSSQIMDIPELVIQHTRSSHEHLPCLFKADANKGDEEQPDNEPEEGLVDEDSISKQSSYEILVIPSRTNSHNNVLSTTEDNSKFTLVHVIDDVPVLLTSANVSDVSVNIDDSESEKIAVAAQALVQASLGNAAKDLGYSADEIYETIGVKMVEKIKENELEASKSEEIMESAKEITKLSLMSAAVSLGFDSNEISVALGIAPNNASLQDITKSYHQEIQKMAKEAVFQAAIYLGYSQEEALMAVKTFSWSISRSSSYELSPTQSSFTALAKQLAKTAVREAAKKLGFENKISSQTFVHDIEERHQNAQHKSSSFILTPVSSRDYDEPFKVIAHNALRNAALSLKYCEEEVLNVVGPEKILQDEATIRKWAKLLAQNAIQNCILSDTSKADMHHEDLQNQGDSEFLVRRYSSNLCEPSDQEVHAKGAKTRDHEDLEFVSRKLCEDAIHQASLDLGIVKEVNRVENNDLKLYAKNLVSTVMGKAVKIVREEKSASRLLMEDKKLKSFALKFSMVVIGSAGKILGYKDEAILNALSRNISTWNKKGDSEKHPNILVKFNQESINTAERQSLSNQQRRESIRNRPLTPKPVACKSNDNVDNVSDIEEDSQGEESCAKMDEVMQNNTNDTTTKERRATPYFPPAVQLKIVEEFNKSKKPHELIIEEEEEEEGEEEGEEEDVKDGEQDADGPKLPVKSGDLEMQTKWSKEFIKKLDSITGQVEKLDTSEDFSELTEAEMIAKIMQENEKEKNDRNSLSEYPTECEFMTLLGGENSKLLQKSDDNEVYQHVEKKEAPPGILDLYSSIQSNIVQCFSETSTNVMASTDTISSSCQISFYSAIPNKENELCSLSNESSYILPELHSGSQVCLTGRKDSINIGKNSNKQGSNIDLGTELPQVISSTTTRSRLSVAPIDINLKSSVPSLPRLKSPSNKICLPQLKSPESEDVPALRQSLSLMCVEIKDSCTGQHIEHATIGDDMMITEEQEVVIKAPTDFHDNSKVRIEKDVKKSLENKNSSNAQFRSLTQARLTNSYNRNTVKNSKPSIDSSSKSSAVIKKSIKQISADNKSTREKSSLITISQNSTPSYAQPLNRMSSVNIKESESHNRPKTNSSNSVFERLSSINKTSEGKLTTRDKEVKENSALNIPAKLSKSETKQNVRTSNRSKLERYASVSSKPSTSAFSNVKSVSTTKVASNLTTSISSNEIPVVRSQQIIWRSSPSSKSSAIYNTKSKVGINKADESLDTLTHKKGIKPIKKASDSNASMPKGQTKKSVSLKKIKSNVEVKRKSVSNSRSSSVSSNSKINKSRNAMPNASTSHTKKRRRESKKSLSKAKMSSTCATQSEKQHDLKKDSAVIEVASNRIFELVDGTDNLYAISRVNADLDAKEQSKKSLSNAKMSFTGAKKSGNQLNMKKDNAVQEVASNSVSKLIDGTNNLYNTSQANAQINTKEQTKKSLSSAKLSSASVDQGENQFKLKIDVTERDAARIKVEDEMDNLEEIQQSAKDIGEENDKELSTNDVAMEDFNDITDSNKIPTQMSDVTSNGGKEDDLGINNEELQNASNQEKTCNVTGEKGQRELESLSQDKDDLAGKVSVAAVQNTENDRKNDNPVSTVTLEFDGKLDMLKTKGSKVENDQLKTSTENSLEETVVGNNIRKHTAKTTSSLKFLPSPPPGKRPSMFMSQSLKAMVSNRAMRAVSKSKSLGSAGRVKSNESRRGQYASTFKESIPMLPVSEGDYQSFTELTKHGSSINDVIIRRSLSKTTASSVWVPSQSVTAQNSANEISSHSPSAVLVKAASSRKLSDSSFTSGHIFVTPAASINFVTSSSQTDTAIKYPTPSSRASIDEIVEKRVSGSKLSNQPSMASNVDLTTENQLIVKETAEENPE